MGNLVDMNRLEMENRDPREINDHLRVSFEDVLAEPEGAHSNECLWRLAFRCFTGGKLCCYRCLTVFCGMFISLCWGCEFACIAFCHVWCCTPQLRAWAINCGMCQKFWGILVQCFCAPIYETCGLFFSRIRIHHSSKDPDFRQLDPL